MIDRDEAQQLLEERGHVFAVDNTDLGHAVRVYVDEYTTWPSFITIASTAPRLETFIALHEAELQRGGVRVPYPPARIEQAPRVNQDQQLSVGEEDALFDYYDVPIEGVVPSVAHLGTILEPPADGDQITAERIEH